MRLTGQRICYQANTLRHLQQSHRLRLIGTGWHLENNVFTKLRELCNFLDFLEHSISAALPDSSYPLPLTVAPFEEFLPARVLDALRRGLDDLCARLPILRHPEAIIVGPESRSSCPVRILRDRMTLESVNVSGLYPMGEGAGYAGGIMSAAIDGMRCAETLIRRLEDS